MTICYSRRLQNRKNEKRNTEIRGLCATPKSKTVGEPELWEVFFMHAKWTKGIFQGYALIFFTQFFRGFIH